jgi:hypothetical protein
MEPKNHKIIRGFLKEKTKVEVIDYVNKINESVILNDHHLKYLVSILIYNTYKSLTFFLFNFNYITIIVII